jgi:hypothetical protein
MEVQNPSSLPYLNMTLMSWTEVVEGKQRQREQGIRREWLSWAAGAADASNILDAPQRGLSERGISITETSMADTLENLRAGKWSAVEVPSAICEQ